MSIQNDIDNALPGGIVTIAPGTYAEQLVIDKPLTLAGPAPSAGEAIIDAAGLAAGAATIHILAGEVTIENLTVQNGPGPGIRAGDASTPGLTDIVIRNNIIKGHDLAGILTANDASMLIENNTIIDNGQATGFSRVGVYLYPHGKTRVSGNIIKNNVIDGIFARASSSGLLIEENIIENHNNSGITLAWDEINVTIQNNEISKCGQGLYDEQGGIAIVQSMAEKIAGNTIKNCSPYGIFWGWTPTSGPAPPQILISGNTITGSERDGIFLFSQGPGGWIPADPFPLEPDVLNNELLGNGRAGVYVSNLYYYSPGNANPKIHFNSIVGNDQYGVYNGTAKEVNAIDNWWGNESGPFHLLLNPEGTGDPVSDNVLFSPWMVLPPPKQIDCLLVEKIFDQCFQEDTIIRGFTVPVGPCEPCRNVDLTKVDRVECTILTSECKIVDVGPPRNDNLRIITTKQELEMKIDLFGWAPASRALCSFKAVINDHYKQVLLYVPPSGAVFGPAGGPFLFCEVLGTVCSCGLETLSPGEPITKIICTINVCKVIEASAFVKVLVPHLGVCLPKPCLAAPQQREIECPPVDVLFPA